MGRNTRAHETLKQAVMVSHQHRPIAALLDPVQQRVNHSATVGATVNQVPQRYDAGILASIQLYKRKSIKQKLVLAVDVANGINRITHKV